MIELLPGERIALLLVDLQQGFLSRPSVPVSGEDLLIRCRALAALFGRCGAPVIATRMVLDSADAPTPRQPVARMMPILNATPKAGWDQLDPAIARHADVIIEHGGWDAFGNGELERELHARNIGQLVIAGISANFAVESTARQAWERGFRLILLEDAIAGIDEAFHEFCFTRIFPRLGFVERVAELTEAMSERLSHGETHAY